MKKILIFLLLSSCIVFGKSSTPKIGVMAVTNTYSFLSFYKFGITASYDKLRVDANTFRADMYYTLKSFEIRSFELYALAGTGTFYNASDIWMLRFPLGVNYSFTKNIQTFAEFSIDYPLFTSGFRVANPGLTNTLNLALLYRF